MMKYQSTSLYRDILYGELTFQSVYVTFERTVWSSLYYHCNIITETIKNIKTTLLFK